MGEDSASTGHIEAQAMLDLFASVGATHFEVTWTNAAGDKQLFRRKSHADLARSIAGILDHAIRQQRNRPSGRRVVSRGAEQAGTRDPAVNHHR